MSKVAYVYKAENGRKLTKEEIEDNYIEVHSTCGLHMIRIEVYKKKGLVRKYENSLYVITKESVKDFIPISENDCKITSLGGLDGSGNSVLKCYQSEDGHYFIEPEFKKVKKDVLEEHKAFVVKGTDYPYYFKHKDRYLNSKTSNWYKYLRNNYGFIAEELLEEYNGPDKENEKER